MPSRFERFDEIAHRAQVFLVSSTRIRFDGLEPDTATGERVGVTGRVVLSRTGGKLCFATLRDGTADLQVMLSLDKLGEESLDAWKRDVDLGDHVGVEGEVITSRRDRSASSCDVSLPLNDGIGDGTKPCSRRSAFMNDRSCSFVSSSCTLNVSWPSSRPVTVVPSFRTTR